MKKNVLIILMGVVLFANQLSAQNLVTNGSFESSNLGDATTENTKGWNIEVGASIDPQPQIVVIDSVVQDGSKALQLKIEAVGTNSWDIQCIADSIPVIPGKDYTYSIWAKAKNPGAQVNFTVGRYNFSEYAAIRPATLTTEWQEFTLEFSITDQETFIRAPLHVSISSNIGNEIYIDNLNIEAVQDGGILLNPGFESGTGHDFTYWNKNNGDSLLFETTTVDEFRSGLRALKALPAVNGDHWDVNIISDSIKTIANKEYTFTFYAKARVAGTDIRAVKKPTPTYSPQYTLTTEWAQYSFIFMSTDTVLTVQLDLGKFANTYFIDDCELTTEDEHVVLPMPEGRRLRDIVEDKYSDNSIIVGANFRAKYFGQPTGDIADREFNYASTANDFKLWTIHPDNEDIWNWTDSDAWIQHISDNNQILRIHAPIGPQTSNWAMDDSRTAEELEKHMDDFMLAVCKRYNNVPGMEYLDVVNEVTLNGGWHKNKPGTGAWENPYFIIGQDTNSIKTPSFIRKAFEIATANAPKLKLIFNSFEGPEQRESWNKIKQSILYLRDLGLRVDGIGWQAHVDVGWETQSNMNNLNSLIDWAHNNNLEFHVTEASVWLNVNTPAAWEAQAVTYRAIIDALISKRTSGKVGWLTWHIDDGHGWHIERFPSIFDIDYEPKPAYYAIQAALEDSSVTGIENEIGSIANTIQLYDNYPNPFNSMTTIPFELSKSSVVFLKVLNSSGQEVAVLADGRYSPGTHKINFNSNGLSSGVYFYSLQTDTYLEIKKMLLLK